MIYEYTKSRNRNCCGHRSEFDNSTQSREERLSSLANSHSGGREHLSLLMYDGVRWNPVPMLSLGPPMCLLTSQFYIFAYR